MLVVGFFQWWYGRGWLGFISNIFSGLRGLADGFSISLLLRTLFSPYKQISAYGNGNDSFQARIGDFFDKMLSRIIGFIMRVLIIIAGIVIMLLDLVASLIAILCWPLLPLLPVACIVLMAMGVVF